MEDLDKVLRPKAPGARPHRRGRPRTVCDDSALARSPPKGLLGRQGTALGTSVWGIRGPREGVLLAQRGAEGSLGWGACVCAEL